MELSFPLDEGQLKSLAQQLEPEQVAYLLQLKEDDTLRQFKEKVRKGLPSPDKIVADMTTLGYLEYTLEVPHLTVVLRTIAPWMADEAADFARRNANNSPITYQDIFSRRQLAYALCMVNGQAPAGAGMAIATSYFEADDAVMGIIKERAQKVYVYLSRLPQALLYQILRCWAAYDQSVVEVFTKQSWGDAIKNSTQTPSTEPSRF